MLLIHLYHSCSFIPLSLAHLYHSHLPSLGMNLLYCFLAYPMFVPESVKPDVPYLEQSEIFEIHQVYDDSFQVFVDNLMIMLEKPLNLILPVCELLETYGQIQALK